MSWSVNKWIQNSNLSLDSGLECIWFLEDAYEDRDIEKFFSLVSLDFKKDFPNLRRRLEKEFNESKQLNLYFHLHSKTQDPDTNRYFYDICWSKRLRSNEHEFWHRDFGKATIVLKKANNRRNAKLLLYDIRGDSPFGN